MSTATRVSTNSVDRVVDLVTTTQGTEHVSVLHLLEPGNPASLLSAEVTRAPLLLTRWFNKPVPDSEQRAHAAALAALDDFIAEHKAVRGKFGLAA